jgi:hypothetical protein
MRCVCECVYECVRAFAESACAGVCRWSEVDGRHEVGWRTNMQSPHRSEYSRCHDTSKGAIKVRAKEEQNARERRQGNAPLPLWTCVGGWAPTRDEVAVVRSVALPSRQVDLVEMVNHAVDRVVHWPIGVVLRQPIMLRKA